MRAEHRLGQDIMARQHASAAIEPLERILKHDAGFASARQELGRVYDAIGEVELERGEQEQGLKSLRKAQETFQELTKKDPSNPEIQWYLANTEYRLASFLDLLSQPGADDLLKKCLETRRVLQKQDAGNIQRDIELMQALARTANCDEADKLVAKVLAYAPKHPGKLFQTACAKAQCARARLSNGSSDRSQSESESAQAVAILKQAIASGYQDTRALATTPDLAPLRKRNDFIPLVSQVKPSASAPSLNTAASGK
jgi:tetratricopeptide (TPR) repeat protein